MNIQTIEGLGYKILITEYITKDIQRRTHKKKRINKKWLKRYGMKIIPDNTKILLVNNTLMMTGKCSHVSIAAQLLLVNKFEK